MNDRDNDIVVHIVRYCNEILEAREYFGDSLEVLESNSIFKNAAAMCILQIGELSAHLTTEFKKDNYEMPWQDIVGMRNVAAHHYSRFDAQKLWETITVDIPSLKAYCEKTLKENSMRATY